jgi:hypothetical protein
MISTSLDISFSHYSHEGRGSCHESEYPFRNVGFSTIFRQCNETLTFCKGIENRLAFALQQSTDQIRPLAPVFLLTTVLLYFQRIP